MPSRWDARRGSEPGVEELRAWSRALRGGSGGSWRVMEGGLRPPWGSLVGDVAVWSRTLLRVRACDKL